MKRLQPKQHHLSIGITLCALLAMSFAMVGDRDFQDCGCFSAPVADAISQSCNPEQPATHSCCAAKPTPAKSCCCSRSAVDCECFDCHCGESDEPTMPPMSMPIQESWDVVLIGIVGDQPQVGLRLATDRRQQVAPLVLFDVALSAQQKCILLSRFNC